LNFLALYILCILYAHFFGKFWPERFFMPTWLSKRCDCCKKRIKTRHDLFNWFYNTTHIMYIKLLLFWCLHHTNVSLLGCFIVNAEEQSRQPEPPFAQLYIRQKKINYTGDNMTLIDKSCRDHTNKQLFLCKDAVLTVNTSGIRFLYTLWVLLCIGNNTT